VQPEDRSVTFTELWLDNDAGVTLVITPPVGPASPAFPLDGDGRYDWLRDGVPVGRIYVQKRPDQRRHVTIALCPTLNHDDAPRAARPGAYHLTLTRTAAGTATVDVDVQRDDTPSSFPQYGRQAYLDDPFVGALDPETFDFSMPDSAHSLVTFKGTLSAHATAQDPSVIVVGGAYDRHAFAPAALYAASAETLNCGAPALSAICEETRAHPGSMASGLFSGSVSLFSGTSMAAPRVARAIVDRLIAGQPHDIPALLGAPVTGSPDPRLGAGVMPYAAQTGRVDRRLRG
jgi:hypothetical protein